MLQQTPRTVTVAPPSDMMSPPPAAVVDVALVTGVVLTVGKAGSVVTVTVFESPLVPAPL